MTARAYWEIYCTLGTTADKNVDYGAPLAGYILTRLRGKDSSRRRLWNLLEVSRLPGNKKTPPHRKASFAPTNIAAPSGLSSSGSKVTSAQSVTWLVTAQTSAGRSVSSSAGFTYEGDLVQIGIKRQTIASRLFLYTLLQDTVPSAWPESSSARLSLAPEQVVVMLNPSSTSSHCQACALANPDGY